MNFLKNLKVSTKIYTSVIILLGMLISMSLIVSNKLAVIGDELHSVTDTDIPLTAVISSITMHQLEQGIELERMLRHSSAMQRDSHEKELFHHSLERFEKLSHKTDEEIKQAEKIAEEAITNSHVQTITEDF